VFQMETYGSLIEPFGSQALQRAATEATDAIVAFGQGAVSRQQALQRVLQALSRYCPPPWKLPDGYEPPRGEAASQDGNPSPGQGEKGAGERAAGEGSGKGTAGAGSPPLSIEGSGRGNQTGEKAGRGRRAGRKTESDEDPNLEALKRMLE